MTIHVDIGDRTMEQAVHIRIAFDRLYPGIVQMHSPLWCVAREHDPCPYADEGVEYRARRDREDAKLLARFGR